MATETSMTKSVTLSKHAEKNMVFLTLTNATGTPLFVGQEVYISGNLAVTKRSLATQFPIGIVTVPDNADTTKCTIAVVLSRTLKAHAKGGTLNAGALVKPNGTYNADGKPEYVAAAPAAGDYISAIVLSGGIVDSEIEIGILRSPLLN